ncbi:gastrula zinc finger protein XlCGF7.1-like [Belonocnema kinseyi]|uniref:gastrula zinc finger protein XlCGF7.1-like n=1 Tax=Belonocnema kinseyi TaxID=2817044 RepID=UPI00143D6058|nr:gastrula zinc finger protein XlCGF7.1-like [Belonocnema kinseyi]
MEPMGIQNLITRDIKLENYSEFKNHTYSLKYMEVASIDIKDENMADPECSSKTVVEQEVYKEYASKLQESAKVVKGKYKCDKCEKTYVCKRTLMQHQRIVHSTFPPSKSFECEFGDYVSNFKSDLLRHINCKHLRQKTFICDECGKSYGRKDSLTYHKKYACKQEPHGLRSNMTKNRPKILKPKYIFDECGTTYTNKSNLQQHNEVACDKKDPRFVCNHCDYKSMSKSNFTRHIMRRHIS